MNPLLTAILKVIPNILPRLIPLADALVVTRGSGGQTDTRLSELETALQALATRSQDLERRLKQMRVMSLMSVALSLAALLTLLVR